MLLGYEPDTALSLLAKRTTAANPAATKFMLDREHLANMARLHVQAAQERQARNANARLRDVTFQVGDKVLLSTTKLPLKLGSSAHKFQPRYVGPFTITRRTEIDRLSLLIPDLADAEKAARLIKLLPREILFGIVARGVPFTSTYRVLAEVTEQLDYALRNSSDSAPMDLNSIQTNRFVPRHEAGNRRSGGRHPQGNSNGEHNGRLQPLTPEERAKLQAEGKCFRCRQPGHIAPNCPGRPRPAQAPNGVKRR